MITLHSKYNIMPIEELYKHYILLNNYFMDLSWSSFPNNQ